MFSERDEIVCGGRTSTPTPQLLLELEVCQAKEAIGDTDNQLSKYGILESVVPPLPLLPTTSSATEIFSGPNQTGQNTSLVSSYSAVVMEASTST